MPHTPLTPVFVGLRVGLHVLVAALLALVVLRVLLVPSPFGWLALLLSLVFAAVYVAGALVARLPSARRRVGGVLWISALTLVWVALVFLVPEAAYLVFPLFFLYLHVLPPTIGPVAVVAATIVAIVALGLHGGFTLGGVIGPLVGAGVALLIGLGYRALAREAAERETLLAELLATRDRLAASEREQGVLSERSRLARELHDTVAQGLSSIRLLLFAAEQADPDRPGIEHVRLARETAADALAETRRFIRELTPPSLDRGLGSALRRLGDQWTRDGLTVTVTAGRDDRIPMDEQTALLRIAQGALANVAQHAGAANVRVALDVDASQVRLVVADDGAGFDPAAARAVAASTDSFGLRAIQERVDQLGGDLLIDSAPGRGTTLTVTLGREKR
ncbi:sensor histidine kinase [Leifsonia sp. ku-ls]|nr:sensor histidine kinase [Leifsonia sp. ku-ls]